MAWISVHEQLLGGKLRRLAKAIGCSQNEALGLLIRLWLWGINNADKDGMIIEVDRKDLAEILNVGSDSRYDSGKAVDALVDTNWIDVDKDGMFIHDWGEWQEQWYKAIDVRQKNAERKRLERERKREERKQEEHHSRKIAVEEEKRMEAVIKNPNPTTSHEESPKKQSGNGYTTGFEEFWSVYPKKVGKGDAYKKYKARLNDGWSPQELKTAAQNYVAKCERERTDKKYIKHPNTFLSETTPFVDFLKQNTGTKMTQATDDDPYADWRK